jgi:hypothetical protein
MATPRALALLVAPGAHTHRVTPVFFRPMTGGSLVDAWWLVVTFMAGGMAGVLVMALMALAADPERDDPMPPVAR